MKHLKKELPVADKDLSVLRYTVREILDQVKQQSDEAIRYYEQKFDSFNPASYKIDKEAVKRLQWQLITFQMYYMLLMDFTPFLD